MMMEDSASLPSFSPPIDTVEDDVKLTSVLDQLSEEDCQRITAAAPSLTIRDVAQRLVQVLDLLPVGANLRVALQTLLDANFDVEAVVALYLAPTQQAMAEEELQLPEAVKTETKKKKKQKARLLLSKEEEEEEETKKTKLLPKEPAWSAILDEKDECPRKLSDGPTIGWEVAWLARDGLDSKTPATDTKTERLGIIVGMEASVARIRYHAYPYMNVDVLVPVKKLIRGVDLLCPTKHIRAVTGSCTGIIGPFEVEVNVRHAADNRKWPTARTFFAKEFQDHVHGSMKTTLAAASGNAIVIPDRVLSITRPNEFAPNEYICRARVYVAMYALTPQERRASADKKPPVGAARGKRKKKAKGDGEEGEEEEEGKDYDPYVHVQKLLPFLDTANCPEHKRLVQALAHLERVKTVGQTQTLATLLRASMRFGSSPPKLDAEQIKTFSRDTCHLTTTLYDYQVEAIEWMLRREGSIASVARMMYFEIPCTSATVPKLLYAPALNRWVWSTQPFHAFHRKLLGEAHKMYTKNLEQKAEEEEEEKEAKELDVEVKSSRKRKRKEREEEEEDLLNEDLIEEQHQQHSDEKDKHNKKKPTAEDWQLPDIRGGVLAEFMGLGKTIEAIALMAASRPRAADIFSVQQQQQQGHKRLEIDGRQATKATLVVAATHHLHVWKEEITSYIDHRAWKPKVLICHTAAVTKKLTVKQLLEADIVLTTRTTLTAMARKAGKDCPLLQVSWFRIFLDEVHQLKSGTPPLRIFASLSTRRMWLMTGTPVTKELGELRAVLRLFHMYGFTSAALWNKVAADQTRWAASTVLPFYVLFRRNMMRHEQQQPYNGRPQLLVLPEKHVVVTRIPMVGGDERQAYKEVEKLTQLMLQAFAKRNNKKDKQSPKLSSYLALHHQVCALQRCCSWHTVDVNQIRDLCKKWATAADSPELIDELVRVATQRSFTPLADSNCPICWEALSASDCLQTPCLHIFCKDCAKQMVSKHQCALCRGPIPDLTSFTLPYFQDAKEAYKPEDDRPALHTKMRSKVDFLIRKLSSPSSASSSSSSETPGKAVIFSQFPATLDELSERLTNAGIAFVSIRSESPAQTAKRLKEFRESKKVGILLAAIRTANAALTLTAARRIIFMEPCYNVTSELQAIERVYRLTQKHDVTIEYLVLEGTKEEWLVQRNQERGRSLAMTRSVGSNSSETKQENSAPEEEEEGGWRRKRRRLPLMFASAGPGAVLAPGGVAGRPLAITSSSTIQELCAWLL